MDDLHTCARAPGNAHKLVFNSLESKVLLEDARIVLAEKTRHGGRENGIGQERSNIDPFTSCVELHRLRVIHRVRAKMVHTHRLVDRRVERHGCDSHRLRTSAAVRDWKAFCGICFIAVSWRLCMVCFTAAMMG